MNSIQVKSYFLLCICTIGLLLPTLLWIPVQWSKIKNHEKNYPLNDPRLTQFDFTEETFQHLIKAGEDEFVYEHMMYDIKNITFAKGNYHVIAIADKPETEWVALKNKAIGNSGQSAKAKRWVFMFHYCENTANTEDRGITDDEMNCNHQVAILIIPYLEIHSPPPDLRA